MCKDDLLARWGGEEFFILFKNTDEDNAIAKVEELRKIIDEYTFSHAKHITANFGLTCAHSSDKSIVCYTEQMKHSTKQKPMVKIESA
ncbi:MAG: diguanylate cyclase [Sulfurovum sp.]|nr:MAG: diguanylate cyclase [Sulfurovum sp.]